MKTPPLILPLLPVFLCAAPSFGQNLPDFAGRWYVHGDIGPAFMQDVDMTEFLGPVSGAEVEFDPGVQFGAGAGFFFTDWLAVEGQLGFVTGYIDRISGIGPADVNDSSMTQVPFLINLILQYPTRTGLVPYIGGGGGVSYSSLDMDEVTDYATYYVDGSDSDAVAAYQGFAGLRYQLANDIELGVVYRYLATDDAHWDVNSSIFAPPPGDIAMDGAEIHSVSFSFRMRF